MEGKKSQSILASFRSAIRGLSLVLKERNFLIQGLIAFMAISGSIIFDIPEIEKIIILIFVALVLGAEMFNSALERVLDLVEEKYDQDVGRIKDMLAGAVFVFSVTAFIAGILIFSRVFAF